LVRICCEIRRFSHRLDWPLSTHSCRSETWAKDACERRAGRSLGISPAVSFRLQPYRHHGSRTRSKPAVAANPGPEFLPHISAPARRGPVDPMPAIPTPNDQANTRRSGTPSVIGGPGGDFFRRSALGASSRLGCRLRWSILPRERGSPLLGSRARTPLSSAAG
jgi:hypothetical protein